MVSCPIPCLCVSPVPPPAAYIHSNQIMGWGEKAIEIRSVETGHLDGVFMHKRAQRLKFLSERNDKVCDCARAVTCTHGRTHTCTGMDTHTDSHSCKHISRSLHNTFTFFLFYTCHHTHCRLLRQELPGSLETMCQLQTSVCFFE